MISPSFLPTAQLLSPLVAGACSGLNHPLSQSDAWFEAFLFLISGFALIGMGLHSWGVRERAGTELQEEPFLRHIPTEGQRTPRNFALNRFSLGGEAAERKESFGELLGELRHAAEG